jgi:tetratricopeptide (TPR) repeat protein
MGSSIKKAFVDPLFVVLVVALLITLSGPALHSKEAPLIAIELFDGPSGAAFLQVNDLLINGKAEVRSCGGATQINKSTYGKLLKIPLTGSVTSLERDAQGVMNLTRGSASECVVPSNLKFEKDESLTPAQLADRAALSGSVLSSSPAGTTETQPFKPTVKIVFVAAPDTELGEYLRAGRAHSVAQWQDYLGRYPKDAHTDSGKQALAVLLLKDGEDSLAAYRNSAATNSPAYPQLRTAYLKADQVHTLLPANDGGAKLQENVHAELVLVAGKGGTELQAYKQALAGHTAGYVHLANARQLADHTLEIDAHFDQGLALQSKIVEESKRVEAALHSAESMMATQHYDEAVSAVADFRSFADEEPRIATVIDTAYKYHFEQGKTDASNQKWHDAVQEYKNAADLKPTSEAADALRQAQAEFLSSTNRNAADAAVQQSAAFQQDKHFIEAYEVLAALPEAPRALVKDQMQALEADYVKNASDEAAKLKDAHVPITGRKDEIGVQQAYNYLRVANTLRPDDDLKLRLDVISKILSDYYVVQAKKYLDKPLGSGVGVAWLYLDEAQQYESSRDDVRDERTKSTAIHNVRSTLSIKVTFRDQTSRRDSSGFADQLSDAIATGLETTNLHVRIIRASDTTPVDPNFMLIGDVVEHRPFSKPMIESLDSEYRASEHEVANPDWNKANREYEDANLDLQKQQQLLEGAQARGKKKEISAAADVVDAAQKKVEEAHSKLDTIPKTVLNDVVKPYSYTRRTVDLSAVVELGFRLVNSNGDTIASNPSVRRSNQKLFVMLENVNPMDTKGVKQGGSPPDEAQFLGDVEIAARETLIKDVKEKVEALPGIKFAEARKHVMDGDNDGAAESYILYLNSTPDTSTVEREEAKKFLRDQFNMVWPGGAV